MTEILVRAPLPVFPRLEDWFSAVRAELAPWLLDEAAVPLSAVSWKAGQSRAVDATEDLALGTFVVEVEGQTGSGIQLVILVPLDEDESPCSWEATLSTHPGRTPIEHLVAVAAAIALARLADAELEDPSGPAASPEEWARRLGTLLGGPGERKVCLDELARRFIEPP